MSKRKLLQLVEEKRVSGWDDPRMPTIAGMRRRGYTPEAIRAFCEMIGVAKNNSLVDVGKLEFCIRDDLNRRAPRVMCVLDPLEVVLEGYLEGKVAELDAPSFPADVGSGGSRKVPLSRRIFIERDDFRETPPPKWHRLSAGALVRLRYAGVIRCDEVKRGPSGEVEGLVCRYLEDGDPTIAAAKIKGTIHWVSAAHALDVEVRLYDRLFDAEVPESLDQLNPSSLVIKRGCKIEPSIAGSTHPAMFQFERQGYFCVDSDSASGSLVFNRTVGLRDGWSKEETKHAPIEERARPSATPEKAAKAPAIDDLTGETRARASRYRAEHDVSEAVAIVLAQDASLGGLFDATVAAGATGKAANVAANLIANELRAIAAAKALGSSWGGKELAELGELVASGSITNAVAKDVLARLVEKGGSAKAIVDQLGATAIGEAELAQVVEAVLAAHPDEVGRFRAGKTTLMGFFVGQVMKRTRGQAPAAATQKLLTERLAS
jgi:glutaminyl-tRNA synthetase